MAAPLAHLPHCPYIWCMAGRPLLLALAKRIDTEGLEDLIFEAVAEGIPVGKMCEKFGITSRKMFYDWKGKSGARHEQYLAARLIAAEAHAEKAGEILDELKDKVLLTGPDVQAATSRSKYQQWLASVKNREEFGTNQAPAVVVAFGELHFDALRAGVPTKVIVPAVAPPTATQITAEPIREAEYEQLDIEDEVAVGNDGEDEAQSGTTLDPISPPTASPSDSELADLL